MIDNRLLLRLLLVAALVSGALMSAVGFAQEKKDKKKEARKGTVVGVLVKKGDNWIEVKADGEEKARRYVPHWRGGAPSAGGGPDKKMVAEIRKVKVGSRVRIEWTFEERPRVEKIEVLRAAEDKKKDK